MAMVEVEKNGQVVERPDKPYSQKPKDGWE